MKVFGRYVSYGGEVLSTSEHGALLFTWSELAADMQWKSSRGQYRLWWQE